MLSGRSAVAAAFPVFWFVAASAPPARAQERVPEAFAQALEQLDRLDRALDELARSPDPAAAAALDKVLRRMGDSASAYRDLSAADRVVLASLRSKKLGVVSFDADTGDYAEVCKLLQVVTGIPVRLTPRAQRAIRDQKLVVVLETEDSITVERFLDAITGLSDALTWRVRGGVAWVTTHEAEAAPDAAARGAAPTGDPAPADTAASIERRIRHHEERLRALRAELAALEHGR